MKCGWSSEYSPVGSCGARWWHRVCTPHEPEAWWRRRPPRYSTERTPPSPWGRGRWSENTSPGSHLAPPKHKNMIINKPINRTAANKEHFKHYHVTCSVCFGTLVCYPTSLHRASKCMTSLSPHFRNCSVFSYQFR